MEAGAGAKPPPFMNIFSVKNVFQVIIQNNMNYHVVPLIIHAILYILEFSDKAAASLHSNIMMFPIFSASWMTNDVFFILTI